MSERCELDHKDGGVCLHVLLFDGSCPGVSDHAKIEDNKGVTYSKYMSDGYSVTIQHCESCGAYLGVNYPSFFCSNCEPSIALLMLAGQEAIDKEKK